MSYEAPRVITYGSISAHTFMPVGPPGRDPVSHKGFFNCRVETSNCELSHGEDGGGLSP